VAKEVQIYVKGVQRKEPDLKKLARALIQLALEQEARKQSGSETAEQPPTEEAS
jgi:hypothetical protein